MKCTAHNALSSFYSIAGTASFRDTHTHTPYCYIHLLCCLETLFKVAIVEHHERQLVMYSDKDLALLVVYVLATVHIWKNSPCFVSRKK